MSSTQEIQAAIDLVKRLAARSDETSRRQIVASLHGLAASLEPQQDTIYRYGHMNLQTASIKIGFDLDLFRLLAEAGGPITAANLCQRTGAGDDELMGRLLRYMAAINVVDQVSSTEFTANNISHNLTNKVVEAGLKHYFYTVGPQYEALPGFLKRTSYANPTDELHTAFQEAWNTPLSAFAWFGSNPANLAYFNDYMALRRTPDVSWLSVYPVEREAAGWDPKTSRGTDRALYVNIGGGVGHQCAQFRAGFPEETMPGRVVLQDLAHTISNALPTPGVDNVAHNFFDPQPELGAKFYFIRGVLHNHPPHRTRLVLERTREAMAASERGDSVLLVDEVVLPDVGGAGSDAMFAMDVTMMAAMAGMERTEAQWRALFAEVGLELVETYMYNPADYEAVMHVRVPRDE